LHALARNRPSSATGAAPDWFCNEHGELDLTSRQQRLVCFGFCIDDILAQ
jgi:hypothetical protein